MTNKTKRPGRVNEIGMSKNEYRGAPTTLCAGCGHNSISNQIVAACYELNLYPEEMVKFSGIGCSSKSPTYFLNRTFGFNSLHGRMPSIATGAMFGDSSLKAIAVSGDGDTASIGMGQFKHIVRRNPNLVYIVENNGVYGLTKGQFSATAEEGLTLKHQGENPYAPVDICMEALIANATFVARSFAGDATQVKSLIKAALSHDGIAILDIISPCVTFNNRDEAHHSYSWGQENEAPIHDITYVPIQDEITLNGDFKEGTYKEVAMHDGSLLMLKKVDRDYDPTSRMAAVQLLEQAVQDEVLVTGLIYIDSKRKSFLDIYDLPETALNRLESSKMRPPRETIDEINAMMF